MTFKEVAEALKEKKIYQIINTKLVQAAPSVSIRTAIELMQSKGSGYIVIAEKKKVIGILTEKEVTQKILGKDINWNAPVIDFTNPLPTTASPDDSVGEAVDAMAKHNCYHLPLLDEDQKLVGVISVRTLIRFLAGFYPAEIYNLPPNFDQIMQSPEGG